MAQEKGFVSDWLFCVDRLGPVQLRWDRVYSHPDADFYTDQDPYSYCYSYSDVHSDAHPYTPARRVDSFAHQRYLGLQ
jgi:hypothetical protein